jgi:hypothetical protein
MLMMMDDAMIGLYNSVAEKYLDDRTDCATSKSPVNTLWAEGLCQAKKIQLTSKTAPKSFKPFQAAIGCKVEEGPKKSWCMYITT